MRHVIDSSGWWSHQAGHFPGGGAARGDDPAHCTLRWDIPSTGSPFSRPASFSPRSYFDRRCEVLQTDDGCDEESDIRQTRAVGRVRTGWLDVRPISWRVQKDKMDSSAPQDTVHIAAAQDTSHRPRSSSSGVRTKAGEPSADELTGTQVGEAPPHRHKQHLKTITSPGLYGMSRGIEPWLMNMDLK